MKLQLMRYGLGATSTLGKLFIDGKFQCYTLEDEARRKKIPGETCIPEGTYRIGLRKEGGFHQRYTARFGAAHKGMVQLYDVPGFEYILIHAGNTERDTAGCVLVGETPYVEPKTGEFTLIRSTPAYSKVVQRIYDALAAGEEVFIEIGFRPALAA